MSRSWPKGVGPIGIAVLMSCAIFLLLSRWAYDDPFITYRYAQNLGLGVGFVYNPGERVLSTTTPLFTLVLSPFAALGFDLHWVANLIGAISMAAGGMLLWNLAQTWQTPWVGWAGLLLYPLFPLALNTMSSETPLYLALCLAAFAAYARQRYSLAALACALATLARPDGILVPAIFTAHFLFTHRKAFKPANVQPFDELRAGPSTFLPPVLFTAILLAWAVFAWAYFGSPIPVTLIAKQSQGAMAISQKFAAGFLSTLQYYRSWPYFLEVALAALGLGMLFWKKRAWLLFIAWPVLYFIAYSLLGVSRYFWYYAPLAPGFVVLVGLGLEAMAGGKSKFKGQRLKVEGWLANPKPFDELRAGPSTFKLMTFSALILLLLPFAMHIRSLLNMPERNDPRYSIYRAAGEWLAQNTPPDATVGLLEVGMIGYYAQRPVVDFAGLIQPDVARQMRGITTYEDTALWAAKQYRPRYVALFLDSLPRFEREYVAINCQPLQKFPASEYNAARDLIVYECTH